MSNTFPDMTVRLQPRRRACVLDPALALSPYGMALGRMGNLMQLWVVRELWHILDNTDFYAQRPGELLAGAGCAGTAGEALRVLRDWERWRLETDQTGLALFWVGDEPSSSLLPEGMDASVVWRYETLARTLEERGDMGEAGPSALLPAWRDAAALATALQSAFVLSLMPAPGDDGDAPGEPLLCQVLSYWGIEHERLPDNDPLVEAERDHLHQVLLHAGLAPLLWSGLRLAALHFWVPGAVTLRTEQHDAELGVIDALIEDEDAGGGELAHRSESPWEKAQAFWYRI